MHPTKQQRCIVHTTRPPRPARPPVCLGNTSSSHASARNDYKTHRMSSRVQEVERPQVLARRLPSSSLKITCCSGSSAWAPRSHVYVSSNAKPWRWTASQHHVASPPPILRSSAPPRKHALNQQGHGQSQPFAPVGTCLCGAARKATTGCMCMFTCMCMCTCMCICMCIVAGLVQTVPFPGAE